MIIDDKIDKYLVEDNDRFSLENTIKVIYKNLKVMGDGSYKLDEYYYDILKKVIQKNNIK